MFRPVDQRKDFAVSKNNFTEEQCLLWRDGFFAGFVAKCAQSASFGCANR
jgi:hypothetical protein